MSMVNLTLIEILMLIVGLEMHLAISQVSFLKKKLNDYI